MSFHPQEWAINECSRSSAVRLGLLVNQTEVNVSLTECFALFNDIRGRRLGSLVVESRVVVEAGTSKTKTETWVAETKTETEAI